MKLTNTEVKIIRSQSLHIVERCDRCGTFLNQSHRYTVAGKPGAYCTAACRDRTSLGAKAERIIAGERCFRCRQHKPSDTGLYCDRCRPFADPNAEVETVEGQELQCEVCGEPVPVLRRGGGSTTCDARCADTLRQRRHRNGLAEGSDLPKLPPQVIDSTGAQSVTNRMVG